MALLLFSEDREHRYELDWAIPSQESFFTQTGLLTSLDVCNLDQRPFTPTALSETASIIAVCGEPV